LAFFCVLVKPVGSGADEPPSLATQRLPLHPGISEPDNIHCVAS